MALTHDVMQNQLAGIDQARAVVAELSAPSYASVLKDLVDEGNFVPDRWIPPVSRLIEELRDAWADRENAEVGQSAEARDMVGTVAKADRWLSEGRAVLRQAERLGVPGALAALGHADTGGAVDTFRAGDSQTHRFSRYLATLGDLTRFGFRPDYLSRGAELLDQMNQDFFERIGHQSTITVQARALFERMVTLADYLEQLNDARVVAEVRLGRELPGFDLRLVRAAAAQARQLRAIAAPTDNAAAPPAAPAPAEPSPGL